MFLIQAIYFSKLNSNINHKDIEQILECSRRNNAKKNITGILAFNGEYFLQALEGSRANVNAVLERIYKDQRHEEICIVHHNEITERDFSDWDMAYAGQDKLRRELILRYSGSSEFIPSCLSGASSLALLKALKMSTET